jgi:endo-1,3(4)-beta-glucanase
VVDTKGTTYLIYALSSITLKATSGSSTQGTIQASGTYNGVLRLVMLAQSGHKALLDQYYQTYPSSVGLDYSFTDTTGTLIFNWNTVGDGSKLLMLTWPHHRLVLQNPNYPATTALAYFTTKVSPSLPVPRLSSCPDPDDDRDICIPHSATNGRCSTN